MVHAAPDRSAPAISELLLDESFELLDISGGWAWGFCTHDRYVGYVPATVLGEAGPVSHLVTARHALVFAAADIKAPVVARWPMGARFAGAAEGESEGDFLRTTHGFVHHCHAVPLDRTTTDPAAPDPATVAETMIGTPYRWGGRSGDGIDCSGLVQQAFARCGVALPRDSDQQRAAPGEALAANARLQRGDLLFFPGHVGIMADAERLVHANAWWMAVTMEPLTEVIARLLPDHPEPVIARKRIAW